MSEKTKWKRPSFSDEFKQNVVDLIVKQGNSFKAAAEPVNVDVKSLRDCEEPSGLASAARASAGTVR